MLQPLDVGLRCLGEPSSPARPGAGCAIEPIPLVPAGPHTPGSQRQLAWVSAGTEI